MRSLRHPACASVQAASHYRFRSPPARRPHCPGDRASPSIEFSTARTLSRPSPSNGALELRSSTQDASKWPRSGPEPGSDHGRFSAPRLTREVAKSPLRLSAKMVSRHRSRAWCSTTTGQVREPRRHRLLRSTLQPLARRLPNSIDPHRALWPHRRLTVNRASVMWEFSLSATMTNTISD